MLVDLVFEKSGLLYRIVHVRGKTAYYYPLWDSMKISREDKLALVNKLESGEYSVVADPCLPAIKEPSQKALDRCKRDYEFMSKLWEEHKDEIVDPRKKAELIKNKAAEIGKGKNTLLRHLDNFLKKSGFTGKADSMLLDLDRCGGPGLPKFYNTKKAEAGPAIPPYFMSPVYEKYFKKIKIKGPNGLPLQKSKKSAWKEMKMDLFTDSQGNVDIFCPSLDQFYKWVEGQTGNHFRLKDQVGEAEYHKNHRQLNGSATDRAPGPNFIWETDTSTIDTEICDRHDREKPIGCAKIVLIKDVYSRMITSVHVFIGSDSWIQQVMSLTVAAAFKPDLTAEVGLQIAPGQWPNKGILPMTLRADRGPFTHNACKQLAKLGVNVEFTESGDPTGKGTVERTFHSLHDWVIENLPGCKHFETVPRGEKDPVMQAKLTLPELKAVIYAMVIEYNNTEHEGITLTPDMISAGVNRVPVEIYQYGMKKHLGQFKYYEPEDLYKHLLPREKRTIRRQGIQFNNDFYVAANSEDSAYLADHRKKKTDISYDINDPGFILLWREDGTTMELIRKGNRKAFAGMSEGEMEAYKRMDKENKAAAEAEWNKLHKETREFVHGLVDSIDDPADKAERRKEARHKRRNQKESIERERELNRKVFIPEEPSHQKQVSNQSIEDLLDLIE